MMMCGMRTTKCKAPLQHGFVWRGRAILVLLLANMIEPHVAFSPPHVPGRAQAKHFAYSGRALAPSHTHTPTCHHGRLVTVYSKGSGGGGQGQSPLNLTAATVSPQKRGVKWNEWRAGLWEHLDVSVNVDTMMIKNDVAVLSINTLGQAVIELVSKGPKATPGMTLNDWVIVSRYFSVAASVSCAWVAVGLVLHYFQGGVDELLRPAEERARKAVVVWLLSSPLALVFIHLAAVPMSLDHGVTLMTTSLGIVVAWRYIESSAYRG